MWCNYFAKDGVKDTVAYLFNEQHSPTHKRTTSSPYKKKGTENYIYIYTKEEKEKIISVRISRMKNPHYFHYLYPEYYPHLCRYNNVSLVKPHPLRLSSGLYRFGKLQ